VAGLIDPRAILRADVGSLPHPLRWIVALAENPKHLVVGDLLRVEHHEHDFSVPGGTAAHLAIDGIGSVPSGIADGGRIDAGKLPELPFGAPETAEPEERELQSLRKRRRKRMAAQVMRRRQRHAFAAASSEETR